MRFLGYNYGQHLFLNNSDPDNINPPAFRGEIRIPILLDNWKPKSKISKKNGYSLRLKSLEYVVGTPPFRMKVKMLGHYFEPKKEVPLELIIIIEAWLMSPQLLDEARLEFSLNFIGEELSSNQTFYANITENNKQQKRPQLPVWTRTHANFNVKFKLHYDLQEFERNVKATLEWHHERIKWYKQQLNILDLNKLAFADPAGFAYLEKVLPGVEGQEKPEILSSILLDQLESARYISQDLKKLVKSYQETLKIFLEMNQNYQLIKSSKRDEAKHLTAHKRQNILGEKLQLRLEMFQRVIKTYEEIKLEKLSGFLEIEYQELEHWLLHLAETFDCFRIRDNKLIIQHDQVDTELLDQLDKKFLEWDLFERNHRGKVNPTM